MLAVSPSTSTNHQKNPLKMPESNNLPKPRNDHQLDKYNQFKKQKETDDFYARLIEFHRHKNVNTPLNQLPSINGKRIDLQKLYNIVSSLGGWERVCEKDKWCQVADDLDPGIFKSCLNGSHALKVIYIRYLSLYEKFDQSNLSAQNTQSITALLDPMHSFNNSALTHSSSSGILNGLTFNGSSLSSVTGLGYHKNSAPNLEDTDSDLNRRRFSYLLELTPMNYNYVQHQHGFGLNQNVLVANPYEKMEISLLSGLPNEIDFVFNTIVLLSSDESHLFKIYQSPRLIDLMLAHVGFFGTCDKFSLRNLYDNCWNCKFDFELDDHDLESFLESSDLLNKKYMKGGKLMSRRNFVKFWHNVVQLPIDDELQQKSLLEELLPELYNEYLKTLPAQELLNLRDIEDECGLEYRRVEQVLVVLNNLSFEDNNADYMANKSPCLFEFLLMCLYCTNTSLDIRKHALDILANLSRKIKLRLLGDKHKQLLITCLYHLVIGQEQGNSSTSSDLITSMDRLDLIRGLEILTKLCSQEQLDTLDDDLTNENILSKYSFEKKNCSFLLKIFSRLEELLTIQDVLILLHCLEFLYNISQFNENICSMILSAQSALSTEFTQSKVISILVNFLTVDMSHFGIQASNSASSTTAIINESAPIKMYKVMPSNGPIIATTPSTQNAQQPQSQSSISGSQQAKSNSLLHQTLNNQHAIHATISASSDTKTIGSNLQQQAVFDSPNKGTLKPNNEQQAKNLLCNWALLISKTQVNVLVRHRDQSKLILQTKKSATFPHIRVDEETSKIHGLKLVLNHKQQLELKQKFSQSKPQTPLPNKTVDEEKSNTASSPSPPSNVSIFIQTPSQAHEMPPTPPISANQSNPALNEDQKTSVLTNGSNKENLLNGITAKENEIINHSDDSLSSTSSTASSFSSGRDSLSKLDEKSNKENDSYSKRKQLINEPTESQVQYLAINEDCSDVTIKSCENSNGSTSPVKKKKLKINEMEEFMNKPINQFNSSISQTVINENSNQEHETAQNKDCASNFGDYACEWNNCKRLFISSKAVYNHVCKQHLLSSTLNTDSNNNSNNEAQLCLWSGCDQMKRQKWSLVNHLLERHCNENSMKTAILCRQRGIVPVATNQTPSNSYLNYSRDAAFFAIQRHHRLKKEDFSSSEEGPITKSIRLLSALTLRNLARNSEKAKNSIKVYESHLANIAFDLLESSNAVSSCLWHLAH